MMASALVSWRRFWFPEVPIARVAILRFAVCAFALIDAAFFARFVHRYMHVDLMFGQRVHALRPVEWVTGDWRVGAGVFVVFHVALIIALVLALIGYRTRTALFVSSLLYLHHFAVFNSWGKVNHGKITIIVALLVLAIAPSGVAYSMDALRRRVRAPRDLGGAGAVRDPLAGWALRAITVFIVLAYLISAYAKFTKTGLSWPFEPILALSFLRDAGPVHLWLIDHPWVLQAMQLVTLVAELGSVALLFYGGRVRNVLLLVLASFHLGSYVLLQTEFFGWIVTYLAFFALESVVPWARDRYRGIRQPRRHAIVLASGSVRSDGDPESGPAIRLLRTADPLGQILSIPAGGLDRSVTQELGVASLLRRAPVLLPAVIGGALLPGLPNAGRAVRRGAVVPVAVDGSHRGGSSPRSGGPTTAAGLGSSG